MDEVAAMNLISDDASNHSLVMLITQALQSQDKDKLKTVLHEVDSKVINSTISQLPPSLIIPLIKELNLRMRVKNEVFSTISWLQCLISTHMSYLTSVPDVNQHLEPLQEYMDSRLENFNQLLSLQGRLHLLVSSVERKQGKEPANIYTPKVVFQDDSSSDENDEVLDAAISMSHNSDVESNDEKDWWNLQQDEQESEPSEMSEASEVREEDNMDDLDEEAENMSE